MTAVGGMIAIAPKARLLNSVRRYWITPIQGRVAIVGAGQMAEPSGTGQSSTWVELRVRVCKRKRRARIGRALQVCPE